MVASSSDYRSTRKAVVEDCIHLDCADLRLLNLLTPCPGKQSGILKWLKKESDAQPAKVSFSIALGKDGKGRLRLVYHNFEPREDVDYSIEMVSTACGLGGRRWWFRCPLMRGSGMVPCLRRVRSLYLRGKYFGCRHCHDLTFASNRRSSSNAYALLAKNLLPTCDNLRSVPPRKFGLLLRAVEIRDAQREKWNRRAYVMTCERSV